MNKLIDNIPKVRVGLKQKELIILEHVPREEGKTYPSDRKLVQYVEGKPIDVTNMCSIFYGPNVIVQGREIYIPADRQETYFEDAMRYVKEE